MWIIGSGRMGLALGSEIMEADPTLRIGFIGRRAAPPPHPLFQSGRATYHTSIAQAGDSPRLILIATSDSGIDDAVTALALHFHTDRLSGTVVLHTSGALDAESLAPLRELGASTGSVHPLVSVADPIRDSDRLRGAWYGVEGDSDSVDASLEIIAALGGHPLELRPGAKAIYHAAAVFASNYVVTLMSVAERLMMESGVDQAPARAALTALAAGTVANVAAAGPTEALTGPVSRGDAATVARHLERLSVDDRLLYSGLAREALRLAVARQLPPDAAKRIFDLLEDELP